MADNFKLSLTIEAFTKGFNEINKNLDEFNDKTKKLSEGFTKLGTKLTVGLTAPISIFAATSIKAFKEQEKNLTKFADSFEKQGARIGIGFDDLKKDADEFAKNSLFESDDILGGITSQLLSFTTINKDVFKQAEQVIIDFAAKTGSDLNSATLAIGKALQNPTEGLNLLRRSGVAVTDAQVTMISALDKAGKSAEAQAAVLKILNDQYGGFAEKIANTDSGKLDQLIKSFKELQQNFGEAFLKVFRPVIEFLTDVIRAIDRLEPQSKVIVAFFATIVAAIGPMILIVGQLTATLIALEVPLLAIAGPVGLLALLAGGLVLASEKFGTLGNAADNFMLQINKMFLQLFNLIDKIPTAFALLIPGLNIVKTASDSLRSVVENNIIFLNEKIDKFIVDQNSKTIPPPQLDPGKAEPTQAELDILAKRAKALAEADAELREKFAKEQLDNAPKFADGLAINNPADPDQVAPRILAGEFSELTKEVNELTEAGRIVSNSFSNAFSNIVSGAESASQAFKNLGRNIVNGLFSAAIQGAFNKLFASLTQIGLGTTRTVPVSTPGLAGGGMVSGPGTATSDSILARLSAGEFVMRADAVKKWGVDFMHRLNQGMMPAFAGGGMMDNFGSYLNSVPKFATGGIVNAQQPSVNVNVINNSSQPVTAKSSQSVDVRGTVVNIILEDLKTNGPISQGNQMAFGLKR